jgi:NAD(P)-dependent dehydrogenase (short-subunit alcohol dehydrogenase family)
VADEAAIAGAFAALARWSDGPGLDLLVNNAGIADPFTGPVEALSLEAWRRRIDVNLTGAFLCARAAVPGLRARRGAIVNIASTRAFQSEPHCEAYAAAKGGLVALTHALAVSLGPEIRVNAVAPGWIEVRDRAKASRRTAPEQGEADRAFHPVGRIGSPEDVAALVAWLTSGEAGFMTGQTLALDGGVSRRMVWPE